MDIGIVDGKHSDRRVEGRSKVTGQVRYVGDLAPEGCLHAAVVSSPIAAGRVLRIDDAAARAVPGVRLVLTHGNADRLHPAVILLGTEGRKASAGQSHLPLQDGRILHAGQHLALVVADTEVAARQAAALVRIHAEATTAHTDLYDPALPPGTPDNGWGEPVDAARGSFDAGWAAGAVRVDRGYETAPQNHVTLEPHATLAQWNARGNARGDGDALEVWEPTTWVWGAKATLAAWFGLHPDQVRVRQHVIGGSFGAKGPLWSHVPLAVMAARRLGRPVKLVLTRHECFTAAGHRPTVHHRVRLAAGPDGRLTALAHDALASNGMADDRIVAPVTKTTRRVYACPNVRTTYRTKRLNLPGPFTMRAPGEAPGMFALECAMDELAHGLGMDPLALRTANHADTDPETGRPWSSKHLLDCYREGAARFGWRHHAPRTRRQGREWVGWGLASMAYDARSAPTAARATLHPDGTLLVESATAEQGTGSLTVYRRLAADTLGWPVERTRFALGDTALPRAPLSAGSMTAGSVGPAVQQASTALRAAVIARACADPTSPLHGAAPAAVTLSDGVLHGRPGTPWGNAGEGVIPLLRRTGPLGAEAAFDPPEAKGKSTTDYSFGAHFAEVRVDAELGRLRVSRYVAAFAAGRILNPLLARSQLEGGIVWGIGMALTERLHLDHRLGRFVNASMDEYHVPVCADIGPIDAFFLAEEDAAVNPLGVKGVGELGVVGAAAAIANAAFNATGLRVRDLPLTPDKLLG